MIGVKSVKTYFGTNAERTAIPLSGFLPGDVFVETDTKTTYQYNGMAWVKTAVDGSNYLAIANDLSDLNNAATARTNLGLVSGGAGDIWVEKAGDVMAGGLVINEDGGDNDTRIEGDNEPNLLFIDAGNDRIGIKTNTPNFDVHVLGLAAFQISNSSIVGFNRFYNPDTTDNNGIVLNFDTNTTGAGATVQQQVAQIAVQVEVHDHATRSGRILFRPTIGGVFQNPSMSIGKNVGIGTSSPTTSARLEISATDGALLLPRMTTTQRNALTAVNGMVIYNTTTNKIEGYEAGAWVDI